MEDHQAPVADKPARRSPWNKVVGAKPPLRPSHVWSVRAKVQMKGCKRDLALFNLAIDSKLCGCDVVAVRVEDVAPSTIDERILSMLSIRQIVLSPASSSGAGTLRSKPYRGSSGRWRSARH